MTREFARKPGSEYLTGRESRKDFSVFVLGEKML